MRTFQLNLLIFCTSDISVLHSNGFLSFFFFLPENKIYFSQIYFFPTNVFPTVYYKSKLKKFVEPMNEVFKDVRRTHFNRSASPLQMAAKLTAVI